MKKSIAFTYYDLYQCLFFNQDRIPKEIVPLGKLFKTTNIASSSDEKIDDIAIRFSTSEDFSELLNRCNEQNVGIKIAWSDMVNGLFVIHSETNIADFRKYFLPIREWVEKVRASANYVEVEDDVEGPELTFTDDEIQANTEYLETAMAAIEYIAYNQGLTKPKYTYYLKGHIN